MASPLYSKVHAVICKYVDTKQASDILGRQLVRCGAADSNFDKSHLATIQVTLIGAIQLYLTDKNKCYAVADELKALA